jgi:hypothetical protein
MVGWREWSVEGVNAGRRSLPPQSYMVIDLARWAKFGECVLKIKLTEVHLRTLKNSQVIIPIGNSLQVIRFNIYPGLM